MRRYYEKFELSPVSRSPMLYWFRVAPTSIATTRIITNTPAAIQPTNPYLPDSVKKGKKAFID